MEPLKALSPSFDRALPANLQACDVDCAHFEELPAHLGWGWCREPGHLFLQGLVRTGRDCRRFVARRAGGAGPEPER